LPLVVVVDDHPLFREGFAHMAQTLRPSWDLLFADSAEALRRLMAECAPDLVIADIQLPDGDGFELVESLGADPRKVPCILVSGRDEATVRVRARSSSARCFIPKTAPPETMVAIIDAVLRGDTIPQDVGTPAGVPELTTRQAEVLMLLGEGHGNKEIRHRLGIAERTVRAHLTDLFGLLGAHSRTQAVLRARHLGLIS
jgi:DNA-binding NarL/FixJ family response regulator